MNIVSILKKNPIIHAVSTADGLMAAADGKCDVIFLLKSDLSALKKSVAYAHDRGKKIFIHIDLADGLGKDEAAVEFVAKFIKPDGIISTKYSLIRAAKELGLGTVYRVFLIDSQGVQTAMNTLGRSDCDFVEVMPGIIFKEIRAFAALNKNLIAGGLIETREEVECALRAGALAVSTSSDKLV
ncbi:MAG: glycerol-3-phosphate responsive antiterminator [Firmicutes bacterium]|nr:glycerol-3-phosphate responsive antiterminator [Bacillota bacterium]MDY5531184.1 glycerol-3-phosphate responsive antiterminator [Pumilibacteraceae bacterium]